MQNASSSTAVAKRNYYDLFSAAHLSLLPLVSRRKGRMWHTQYRNIGGHPATA